MYSICNGFYDQDRMTETLDSLQQAQAGFGSQAGVVRRHLFRCRFPTNLLWSVTEWVHEEAHHDAAQRILKTRRDDRIASARPDGSPYFEIFCERVHDLCVGRFSSDLTHAVVVHGTLSLEDVGSSWHRMAERFSMVRNRLSWCEFFLNSRNSSEFVAFFGYADAASRHAQRLVGELTLEEFLVCGLQSAFSMAPIAGYNQFEAVPLCFGAPS